MTYATKRITGLALVLTVAALIAAPQAGASGVELQEQGQGLGNSFAGAQAVGEDPSTIWWNPAGMARLKRSAISAAGYAIMARGDFVDRGSFRAPGIPFTGESGQTDEPVPVPSVYGVWKLDRCWTLGLGINAPFGLTTDWGKSWIGRYYGTKSALLTANINPSVSYRVNKCLSIGVGISAMYAHADLNNSIDFGAAAQMPQAFDGQVEVTGDSWGIGYNAGLLWEPGPCTRLGLHYRSRVEQSLEGDAKFDVPPPAAPIAAATGRFRNTDAQADIIFPDQLSLGIAHDINKKWTVLASVVWTNWSLFKDLRVRFQNPNEPDAVTPLDWEDTVRVALGVTFRPNDCWTFRAGTQWDQSPIPDATRTPRIPMNDRIWVSVGAGYRFNRHLRVELSYAHLFIEEGNIDLSSAEAGFLSGYVDGTVDIVGLQLTWDF